MGTTITINASPRTLAGTGGARAVRTSGMVPGIVYGNKKDPEMIALEPRSLMAECMQPGFFSKLYSLSINGAQQEVLAKHVQFHPVTDRPLHVDFMRVSKGAKVHGVLNIIHHNLELICPAQSIPEKLVVDLTGREINQTIHLEALALPEGVIAAHPDRDNTIATIVAPTVEEEKPAGAEGTEATPEAGATPASGGGSTPPAAS